jgi:peptide/nickel transport system substrate-binding protein
MEMLSGKFKLDALKREVEQGGYKGEKVVFLGASDVARISAICQVGADVLSKIGLNVDPKMLQPPSAIGCLRVMRCTTVPQSVVT